MIPADTLKLVQDTAVKAAGPSNMVIKIPGEAAHVARLVLPDGSVSKLTLEPAPDAHAAYDVATVVRYLNPHVEAGHPCEVWYSRDGVVGLADAAGVRHRCRLDTPLSVPLAKLAEWGQTSGVEFDQGGLWRLLRTVFAGCLTAHPNLKEQVGRVDIKKAQEAAGTIDRKGVSMSRKLVAEASGADQLPEVVTFTVPVFDSAVLVTRAAVQCAFDLDPQSEKFRLVVLPGEIEKACAAGEQFLFDRIAAELTAQAVECPVYYGEPG